MQGTTYKGEITLIKIKDGTSVTRVYDFYTLGKTIEAIPAVPSEQASISEIELSGWSQEAPSGFGKDNPVIWNFKRTQYDDGRAEHSEAVVASFWATAPEVKAKYCATQDPNIENWSDIFNENEHNYIIFSYDDGVTWTPQGGIRIKGKVSVDEEAVVYNLSSTHNELIRYIDENTSQPFFSPGIIDFTILREYLGLVDSVDLVEEFSESGDNEFRPRLQCDLISYADLGTKVNLNEIFESDYAQEYIYETGKNILEYNYAQNKITLNFSNFYDMIEKQVEKNLSQVNNEAGYAKAYNILNNIESFLETTVLLIDKNNEEKKVTKKTTIRYSTSYDLASLDIYASGIVQSIQNTKLIFNSEGLTIQNGGFKIYSDQYQVVTPNVDDFASYEYYIFVDDKYVKYEGDYVEGLTYYEKTQEKTLGADNFGNLYIKGTGEFEGKIYAQEGEFRGEVKAKSGFLENLMVNGTLTVNGNDGNEIIIQGLYSPIDTIDLEILENWQEKAYYYDPQTKLIKKYDGITLQPEYDYYIKSDQPGIYSSNFSKEGREGFWIDPTTGSIYATSIVLGAGTTIYDSIDFPYQGGIASIKNPSEKNNGTFIEIQNDGTPSLKITTEGKIYAGNISNESGANFITIDGPNASIQSGNYLSGALGWKIDNNFAEFNDIIARGTLKAVTFEKNEVSTVGGMILVRPSSIIKNARIIEDKETNTQKIELTLETKDITFDTDDEKEGYYYFRIGTSSIAYRLYKESQENDENEPEKIVIIDTHSGIYDEDNVKKFIGQILIGYGREGDIGVGINSSSSGVAMPAQAISVFETVVTKPAPDVVTDEILGANPRIILGAIEDGDSDKYGLKSYGLYADQVNVKGELSSKSEKYYSGINSNSTVQSIINNEDNEPNEDDENATVIIWAGAKQNATMTEEEIRKSVQEAPFRVDTKGNIYASQGYFSGEINSSLIKASILETAVIRGIGHEEEGKPALTIENTAYAIKFEDAFELTNKKITASVPLYINEINTDSISLSQLLINNSNIKIKAEEGDLAFVFKDQEQGKEEETGIITYASSGIYVKQNGYFNKNVYFGEENMEYRQITEQHQGEQKILGYDLYIKS